MPSSGAWPPSPGSSLRAARQQPDGGTDDEEPRRRVPSCVGKVVPEPVLELVDEREEDGGDQRRRDADRRAEHDQPQVAALGHRTHIIPTGR